MLACAHARAPSQRPRVGGAAGTRNHMQWRFTQPLKQPCSGQSKTGSMQSFEAHMPPSSLGVPASGNVKGGSMKGGGVLDPPSSPDEPEEGGVLESSPGVDPSSPVGSPLDGVVASSEVQEVQASSPRDEPEELESSDPEPDCPPDPEPEEKPAPGSMGELVPAQPATTPPSPSPSPSPSASAKAPAAADSPGTPVKAAFLWTSRSTRKG